MIVNRHPHGNEVYLVNDRHDIHDSIKNSQHFQRAGNTSGFSKNVFPKSDIPQQIKLVLSSQILQIK